MAFDTKAWLKSLNLTEEQSKSIETALADEKVAKAVGDTVMMRSDYSRGLDEAKKEVEKAKADKTRYFGEVTDWWNKSKTELENARQAARTATESLAQYKTRLEGMVAAGDIDAEDVKDLMTIAQAHPPAKNDPPAKDDKNNDDGRYLTRDQFAQEAQQVPLLSAAIADLQAEHLALFGRPAANMSAIVTKAMQEKKPLREVWEAENKVSERRAEIALAEQKKHDDDIRAEERRKVTEELSNPVNPPDRSAFVSPALQQFARADKPGATERMSGVAAAVAAHNSGKYRTAEQ